MRERDCSKKASDCGRVEERTDMFSCGEQERKAKTEAGGRADPRSPPRTRTPSTDFGEAVCRPLPL